MGRLTMHSVHTDDVTTLKAVWMKTVGKKPGMSTEMVTTYLDLTYKNRYEDYVGVDAYEVLIQDVLNGEQQHFVRSDELAEAWRIWTQGASVQRGSLEDVVGFHDVVGVEPLPSCDQIRFLSRVASF
jgi:hypothetical protein